MNLAEYNSMSEEEKKRYWAECYRMSLENDITPMAEALSEALNDKELMAQTAEITKRMVDGDPVNVNPLTEIPAPEMVIYGIGRVYFSTKRELEGYCAQEGLAIEDAHTLEYFRQLADCSDVIRKTTYEGNSTLCVAIDEDGYGMYNHSRSVYRGEFVWEFQYGSIRAWYKAFKERGVAFTNDVYGQIEQRYADVMKRFRG